MTIDLIFARKNNYTQRVIIIHQIYFSVTQTFDYFCKKLIYMKFYQRFAYYLVGLVIGCFLVATVLSGKDTRCNYFPNARVLNDLRNKPFEYDSLARVALNNKWIDTLDIKNTLTHGDVDFDKSNIKENGGKLYTVYGQTSKGVKITLLVINYSYKAVLKDIQKSKD